MFGFGKKKQPLEQTPAAVDVTAPAPGVLLGLDAVPDPVFSGGLVGPGFAVNLAGGSICAPVAGTVVLVPETRHAIGIRAENGAEVLVHVGVDSVALKGEGFAARVREGEEVAAGQAILDVDLELLRARIPSVITPVVVSNADGFEIEGPVLDAAVGERVLAVRAR
ncbi:PTS sugar transporter subunit IIA [Brachybacterium hainanense]|uniref:PTS glucose transporter subunit IIA n=1 Tax=Brachybacterium hainanense TaxID=1541174 RepID=A0ABV6R5T9_9MICO